PTSPLFPYTTLFRSAIMLVTPAAQRRHPVGQPLGGRVAAAARADLYVAPGVGIGEHRLVEPRVGDDKNDALMRLCGPARQLGSYEGTVGAMGGARRTQRLQREAGQKNRRFPSVQFMCPHPRPTSVLTNAARTRLRRRYPSQLATGVQMWRRILTGDHKFAGRMMSLLSN